MQKRFAGRTADRSSTKKKVNVAVSTPKKIQLSKKIENILEKRLGFETLFHLIAGNNLDFYFAILINIKYYKSGSQIGELNTLFSFVLFIFLKIFLGFSALQIQKSRSSDKNQTKADKTNPKNGQTSTLKMDTSCLVEGIRPSKSWFVNYFTVITLAKDIFIAFFVIIFYDLPFIQAPATLIIMTSMTVMEAIQRPLSSKSEMVIKFVTDLCFSLTNFLFLMVYFLGKPATDKSLQNIGLSIIALLSLVILTNVMPGVVETINSIRKSVKKLFSSKQKQSDTGVAQTRVTRIQPSTNKKESSSNDDSWGSQLDLDHSQEKSLNRDFESIKQSERKTMNKSHKRGYVIS